MLGEGAAGQDHWGLPRARAARQAHGPTRKLPGVLTQGWQGDSGENRVPGCYMSLSTTSC